MVCHIAKEEGMGSGLEMTHFFNNKKVLMENVLFQDLTPYLLPQLLTASHFSQ